MRREPERGFILIGAVWLLVLAGSLAAVLVLHGLRSTKSAAVERTLLRSEMAAEGAVDVVVADALFNGPRSRWWNLPARGVIKVAGIPIFVEVTSEASRLDLNSVDLKTLDNHLREGGVGSKPRALLIVEVASRRAGKRRYRSFDEVRSQARNIVGDLGEKPCLMQDITIYSGYAVPPEGQNTSFISDSPVRVDISAQGAPAITAIIRAGVAARAYDVLEWTKGGVC
jgi:hypothetical protein